ncbi:hypothetical protein NEMIN01_1296 [Nematocida minor]|uniref:uncharacterized protein n=1 Tax=Nematocida minor TaxID=1912983 RepID=UPI00221F2154|nr:uncharacterized protein NEMIN01_1296 [Nematocida minor]KAI5190963.1 hypothetical protein NEMIN01_1296 [Nematocida minor]
MARPKKEGSKGKEMRLKLPARVEDLRTNNKAIFPPKTSTLMEYIKNKLYFVVALFKNLYFIIVGDKACDPNNIKCLKLIIKEAVKIRMEQRSANTDGAVDTDVVIDTGGAINTDVALQENKDEKKNADSTDAPQKIDENTGNHQYSTSTMRSDKFRDCVLISKHLQIRHTEDQTKSLIKRSQGPKFNPAKREQMEEANLQVPLDINVLQIVFTLIFIFITLSAIIWWMVFLVKIIFINPPPKLEKLIVSELTKEQKEVLNRYNNLYSPDNTGNPSNKSAQKYYEQYLHDNIN